MSEHRIVEEQDAKRLARELEDAIDTHNMELTGFRQWWHVAFSERDESGGLAGGIFGYVWADWLHVVTLWVRADRRGRGLGQALLRRAEEFARGKGCRAAYLSTFDFQAPALYARNGYRVIGRLADYPMGHTHFFLQKDFAK